MNKIISHLSGNSVSSNTSMAHFLYDKWHFGEKNGDKIDYSPLEALFLLEGKKMDVLFKGKKIGFDSLMIKFSRIDKKIHVKYIVFRDLRKKGYVVKSALKFGAEFRVYDKRGKNSEMHSKWLVFTEEDSKKISWHEFSSKNRVAHATRKNLLLAIVDSEKGITYYEVRWIKP